MRKTLSFIIISMMAFCAFAQDLYIGSFYVTTPDEEKQYGDGGDKWTTRRTYICDIFNFEQPDVLGLQSVTESQVSFLNQRMTTHNAIGNIIYKKELELVSNGTIEEMPEGSTCSWVKLKKGDAAFYVFNVSFSTDATLGNTSATKVMSAVEEINTEGLPNFVLGYLGGNEKKTAYTRLSARFYDCYKKAPIISAEYGTVSNFDLAANHSTDRFDFIFTSKDITTKAYGQLQSAYLTKETDGSYKRRQFSTHFPVMAKVTLP